MLDYSNKQCVLDGKLIEHCTYNPLQFDFNVMPCQSFPIEAIQYTGKKHYFYCDMWKILNHFEL